MLQPIPAVVGWPGDGDYYLMHRMQSGGWPYLYARQEFLECFISLSSCPLKLVAMIQAMCAKQLGIWARPVVTSGVSVQLIFSWDNFLTFKSRSSISLSLAAVSTGLACPNIELEALPPSPLSLPPDVSSSDFVRGWSCSLGRSGGELRVVYMYVQLS